MDSLSHCRDRLQYCDDRHKEIPYSGKWGVAHTPDAVQLSYTSSGFHLPSLSSGTLSADLQRPWLLAVATKCPSVIRFSS